MKKEHLDLLMCPRCGSRFNLAVDTKLNGEMSRLICAQNNHDYPVKNGIPRFVDSANYADSFGFQWKKFSRVQLDSYNGTGFSEERLQLITGWEESELQGKLVLDAGCGAGRFAEIAAKYKANLVTFDLSEAVDICKENLASEENLICQASVYELPFYSETFDFVYCIGVVQHTPDPVETIRALCRMVQPGGQIGLWVYERDWKSYFGTLGFKYALRPFLRRLSRGQHFSFSKKMTDIFYPLALICKRWGVFGRIIMRLLPVASAHLQHIRLADDDFKTWILLDTLDMYSPAYDQPQTYATVAGILSEEGFENIRRHPHGGISITAIRQAHR